MQTESSSPQRSAAQSPLRTEFDIALPLPGSVVTQTILCGKPGCHCNAGFRHGPYYYRIWREGSKVRKVYVPKNQLSAVLAACALHQQYSERLAKVILAQQSLTKSLLQANRQTKRLTAALRKA